MHSTAILLTPWKAVFEKYAQLRDITDAAESCVWKILKNRCAKSNSDLAL
jgi:hypothetical protein